MKGPVTLTTDFGTQDHYVACMKAVILQISAATRIIDVTQEEAERTTRDLAAREGIFSGISSGGAVCATLRLQATLAALMPALPPPHLRRFWLYAVRDHLPATDLLRPAQL